MKSPRIPAAVAAGLFLPAVLGVLPATAATSSSTTTSASVTANGAKLVCTSKTAGLAS